MKESKKQPDMEFEIQFYESVLQHSPNFVELLMALGDLYTKKGFYQKGLEVDLKLSVLRPEDPYVHYNLACSYALMGSKESALASIRRALETGYEDFEHLEHDADLALLLDDPDFKKYLSEFKRKKKLTSLS